MWTFAAVLNPGNKNTDATYLQLVYATNTKIIRFHKIVAEANPFNERWTGYYEEREGEKLLNSTKGREKLLAIWRAQKHMCPVCGEKITADTGFRMHIVTLNEYSRRTSMVHSLVGTEGMAGKAFSFSRFSAKEKEAARSIITRAIANVFFKEIYLHS